MQALHKRIWSKLRSIMTPFELLSKLPAFLEIRLQGTEKCWENASPRLTMIGSKIRLSYGIAEMEYTLYEGADDDKELQDAVSAWAERLANCVQLYVHSVSVGGQILENDSMDIEILKKAIEKWGRHIQVNKIQEEALELALVLNQINCPTKNREEMEELLYSELADMKIMMVQAELLFDAERINKNVDLKIERLKIKYFNENT